MPSTRDYQDQLDTRALELATQAHARIDGVKELLNVSIDGLNKQLADNRRSRDEQHASAEEHFKVIYGKFDHLQRWQISTAGAFIVLLLTALAVLIEPSLVHH
jgi:hypothetical protein